MSDIFELIGEDKFTIELALHKCSMSSYIASAANILKRTRQ